MDKYADVWVKCSERLPIFFNGTTGIVNAKMKDVPISGYFRKLRSTWFQENKTENVYYDLSEIEWLDDESQPVPVEGNAEEVLAKYWDKNNYMQAYYEDQKKAILQAMESYRPSDDRIEKAIDWVESRIKHYNSFILPPPADEIKIKTFKEMRQFLQSLK